MRTYHHLGLAVLVSGILAVSPLTSTAQDQTIDLIAMRAASNITDTIFDNSHENYLLWAPRIEVQQLSLTDSKPVASILAVQPLWNDGQNYVFNQSRGAYGDDRTTINVGLGYRYLTDNALALYGLNSFYDLQMPTGHQRSGLGAEFRTSAFEMNANYYMPMTGWRDVSAAYEEKALEGYDAEIGGQVPYMPWAWAFAKAYRYESEIADTQNTTGTQLSLRLRPLQNIEVEGGLTNDNTATPRQFVRVSYRIAFGEPNTVTKKSMFSSRAFESGESMKPKVYDKVRRSNDITVQRRARTGRAASGATARVRVAIGS